MSLLVMYLRFLEVFLIHRKLGPTLIMIKEMVKYYLNKHKRSDALTYENHLKQDVPERLFGPVYYFKSVEYNTVLFQEHTTV